MFHFHLTVKAQSLDQLQSLVRKSGGKATAILLRRGKKIQQDLMITRYGKSVQDCKVKALKAARAIGFDKVLRLKIEEEVTGSAPELKEGEYFELHAEALDKFNEVTPRWLVGSVNVVARDGMFLNFRAKNLKELNSKLEKSANYVSDRNVHLEIVRYDSNPNHDSWWA